MPHVDFPSYPLCRNCKLWGGAKSVGMATHRPGPALRSAALVVCGQNPGAAEDAAGVPFVGPSGRMLKDVYLPLDLDCLACLYLTNGARCGPDSISTPGPYNACIPYIFPDLTRIEGLHTGPLALLFTSAPAVTAFYKAAFQEKCTQKQSMAQQGRRYGRWAVFSTYHPAFIMRDNQDLLPAVSDHILLVLRHLRGEERPSAASLLRLIPPAPPSDT